MRVMSCFLLLLAASVSSAQEQFDTRLKLVEQRIAALRERARKAAEPRLALDREVRALDVALEAARRPDGNPLDAARIEDIVRRRADLEARRAALARESTARRMRATRAADRTRLDALLKSVRGGDLAARQELTRLLMRIDHTHNRPARVKAVPKAPSARSPKPESVNPVAAKRAADLERNVIDLTRKVLILETRLRELRRAIAEAAASGAPATGKNGTPR